MSNTSMYHVGLDAAANAIKVGGNKRTVLLQGHMGTGKTSVLKMLGGMLPGHKLCYVDCTTKDLGDLTIPNVMVIDKDSGFVRYVPNEELGLHLNGPVIIMVDEYGKANAAVKLALLALMLERKMGSYSLHPDSLVFATTNLGAEGVGDLIPPHARNRISVVKTRKPDNMEWIEWGLNNGIDPILLSWCKDNPQLFYSFEDVANPDDNPYIFHPNQQRAAFVTPRSLEAASDWLKKRDEIDDHTMTALLMGTIGDRGAMDLMAFVKLADQLPTLQEIKDSPTTAKVPSSAAGVCMTVYRTLATIDAKWVNAWMDYLVRLDSEAQGLFANGICAEKYDKTRQSAVMTNAKFTAWARANSHMFAADKR